MSTSVINDAIKRFVPNKEVDKNYLKNTLELHYGVTFSDIKHTEIDKTILAMFNTDDFDKFKFLPIKQDANIFTIAMAEPNNILSEREIKLRLKRVIDLKLNKVVVFPDDLKQRIQEITQQEHKEEATQLEDTEDLLSSMDIDIVEHQDSNMDLADLSDSAQEAPIIQLANKILGIAISKGISDIHIEPREKEMVVRFRQDGVLNLYKKFPKKIQNALISRYKIMADLNIAERRLPQDGRIRVKMNSKFIDFRVSTLPGKFGEKIVMRILDKSNISFGLEQLITNKDTLATIRDMINRPYGIIFVTGPTGSGKTTTLYSALSERNTSEVNISTVEDPIEYDLEGITQTEVNKAIGLDFSIALKAFLRQDPDIMLVGETRDKETAKTSVEAALTGHLVFTTLHTNDAPSSIMRLKELDIEPFLISNATIGIIAQRLLRRICPHCKEEYIPEDTLLEYLSLEGIPNKKYYRGKGCEHCNHTGYKGRVGAYEVMKLNDKIRELIAADANSSIIKTLAREMGMKTLLEYSIELAQEGHTTLDEVIRVTFNSDNGSKPCPNCGKSLDKDAKECHVCNHQFQKKCPKCGDLMELDSIKCENCGESFNEYEAVKICPNCTGEMAFGDVECPWCFHILKTNVQLKGNESVIKNTHVQNNETVNEDVQIIEDILQPLPDLRIME